MRAIRQPALPVPGGVVVDATAAGDAFRAALAVALVEGRGEEEQRRGKETGGGGALEGRSVAWEEALRFAAAAGAIAVSRMGAMPRWVPYLTVQQRKPYPGSRAQGLDGATVHLCSTVHTGFCIPSCLGTASEVQYPRALCQHVTDT